MNEISVPRRNIHLSSWEVLHAAAEAAAASQVDRPPTVKYKPANEITHDGTPRVYS